MDKVFIKNLSVRAIIGINPWERENPQEILINIILKIPQRAPQTEDSIDHCVNYHLMADKIAAHTKLAKRFTVEALAEDIAKICLDHPLVKKAIVKIEKTEAINYTETVGIEIERE